jgi:transposase
MGTKIVYVGIDVGKDWLDFAVSGIDRITRFGNHHQGIEKLVAQKERLL